MNFDERAATWDSEYRVRRGRAIADKIVQSCAIPPAAVGLEYGCGTGLVGLPILDRFSRLDFYDPSTKMIDLVLQKAAALPSPTFGSGFTERERLPLGTYDLIFSSMVFHHIRDLLSEIAFIRQLLKGGGTLCVVDLNPDDGSFHRAEADFDGHHGFDPELLAGLFQEQGLRPLGWETFFRDTRAIDGKEHPYSLFILRARLEAAKHEH